MIKRLLIVLLALAVVLGGIFGWKYYRMQQMAAQMAQPQPPAVIASAEVEAERWRPSFRAVGSLVAVNGVDVTNEVAGQVSAIRFESGEPVEKGEVLVQLDDSVDQADLEGLVAQRRLAEIQFERLSRLVKQKSASQADLDEARAQLDNARAQVAAKRALIAKKRIRAPFAGELGIRQINLGEYLAPGSRIVSLQALEPIHVDYSLPERHYAKVAREQRVTITVSAHPERTFEGRVTAINPQVEADTRNVRVRATFDNDEGLLRPGMFAEVRTWLPERERVLTLPRTAITYNPYGDSVFVIQEQDGGLIAKRHQIDTGEVRGGRVEIVKGLEEGERVVRAGHQKLRSGQAVEIDNSVPLDEQIAGS